MDHSQHRNDIRRSLEALEKGIAGFVNALAHSDVPCLLEDHREPALRIACEAYAAIDYGMEDKVNSSVVCAGVIGVSADILKTAQAVNALKQEFKAACAPLSRRRVWVPVKNEKSPTRTLTAIRVILREISRSDLNLLAAYRQIPILMAPPTLISFTRATTRAVYRKSLDEIYTMLLTSEHPKASADRARLETLGRGESHLALVMQHYKNLRANILYARLDRRGRGRVQVAAELPILYLKDRHEAPEVRFPEGKDLSEGPKQQRQSKLEDQPFLESIPAYRYRARHAITDR